MSSISNSTYYSVSANNANSSQGIAGLMSGMDTEAMVNKMLSGTQSKIDKQQALKQQTIWKQEIYRDVIQSINGFYDKYFDTAFDSKLTTNFANKNFFNAMTSAVTSGNSVKVISTGTTAVAGDLSVIVKKMATRSTLNSSQKMSTNEIVSETLKPEDLVKQFDKTVAFSIEGENEPIEVNLNGLETEDNVVKALNKKLNDKKITVTAEDGKLTFTSADNKKITVSDKSSELGLKTLGLSAGNSSGADKSGKQVLTNSKINTQAGYTFNISFDGVQKSITISDIGNGNMEDIQKAVQGEVQKAFGEYITVGIKDGNKLTFAVKGDSNGHEILITGADARKLGITPGSSTLVNNSTKLKDLQSDKLLGDIFEFTINGTDFSFDGDTTIGAMMNEINRSSAGVKISYSSLSDSFKMEASSTGANYGINMTQSKGNILSVMFGSDVIEAASSATSQQLTTNRIVGDPTLLDAEDYKTDSAALTMNVNGKDYTFSLPKKEDKSDYTKDEIIEKFNDWLGKTFGKENIQYKNGNLEIKEGYTVSFKANGTDRSDESLAKLAAQKDLAFAMGFNTTAQSNIATANSYIGEIHQIKDNSLNGKTVLGEYLAENNAIKFADGRLTLTNSIPSELSYLLGNSQIFGDGKLVASAVVKGTDAEVILNGVETTRSSNTFTVDGITLELTGLSKELEAGKYEETVIGAAQDTDKIVEGFKSFVQDYNTMIEKLNKYITEDSNYKKYAPLTSEQKKDMSEREIELWEEKSKQGLIRNDNTVSGFLSQMRTLLYTKPAGSPFALYDIGIETTSQHKDGGKLQLDEAALRKALTADPDGVRNLFMDSTEGLSKKIMSTIKQVAERSSGSAGELVRLAGLSGTTTEKKNTLYSRITEIERRIKELEYKYSKERTRYWNQFTSMEKIMSNFSSQSAALAQQFGSN